MSSGLLRLHCVIFISLFIQTGIKWTECSLARDNVNGVKLDIS